MDRKPDRDDPSPVVAHAHEFPQMKDSKIEWCHHTVNFWWGCTKVSAACFFCYAEAMARIFAPKTVKWGAAGARWLRGEKAGSELHGHARRAKRLGVRHRVFINSMSDTFEDNEQTADTREYLFTRLLEVGYSLDCLLLTKRPENVLRMVPKDWLEHWPSWVWIGTTVEDQTSADLRIPELIKIPARVRFLSCEPLLGPVNIEDYIGDECDGGYVLGSSPINWVICGGESGPNARPMHPDWAKSLREQCAEAAVPFFFKQWGEWTPSENISVGNDLEFAERVDPYPAHLFITPERVTEVHRIGKKSAGRLLDGVDHSAFPEVQS